MDICLSVCMNNLMPLIFPLGLFPCWIRWSRMWSAIRRLWKLWNRDQNLLPLSVTGRIHPLIQLFLGHTHVSLCSVVGGSFFHFFRLCTLSPLRLTIHVSGTVSSSWQHVLLLCAHYLAPVHTEQPNFSYILVNIWGSNMLTNILPFFCMSIWNNVFPKFEFWVFWNASLWVFKTHFSGT